MLWLLPTELKYKLITLFQSYFLRRLPVFMVWCYASRLRHSSLKYHSWTRTEIDRVCTGYCLYRRDLLFRYWLQNLEQRTFWIHKLKCLRRWRLFSRTWSSSTNSKLLPTNYSTQRSQYITETTIKSSLLEIWNCCFNILHVWSGLLKWTNYRTEMCYAKSESKDYTTK